MGTLFFNELRFAPKLVTLITAPETLGVKFVAVTVVSINSFVSPYRSTSVSLFSTLPVAFAPSGSVAVYSVPSLNKDSDAVL